MGKCISKNKHDSVKSCFLVIFADTELINYDLFTGPDVICDYNFYFGVSVKIVKFDNGK